MERVGGLARLGATAAAALALAAFTGTAAPATAQPLDDTCDGLSPSAAPCIGFQKLAERLKAECRRAGLPPTACRLPLGHDVGDDVTTAYVKTWVHRAAAFQSRLGDPLPLRAAQWLGTHNSFNSANDSPTLSKTDSNQQLSLTQQLDSDIRALELDVHWVPSLETGGANGVVVCHARGPEEEDLGCTNERLFADVLPEIAGWLDAHPSEVILLYLEDNLGDPAGYQETIDVLHQVLGSRIYKPGPIDAKDCDALPLRISRDNVRRRGAQVVLVGNCRSGWASDVFGWDGVHVESGSTAKYRAFPACDATYSPEVYDRKLVRYYEDSTFVSAAVDPTWSPADQNSVLLNPNRVAAMTRCGVNLFGFDQFLPGDGRILGSIWSWATNKPDRADGRCTVQGSSGRWTTRRCLTRHRGACLVGESWELTLRALSWKEARATCRRRGGRLGLPRSGLGNELLRTLHARGEVWLAHRLP
jgi:hypothetical protein